MLLFIDTDGHLLYYLYHPLKIVLILSNTIDLSNSYHYISSLICFYTPYIQLFSNIADSTSKCHNMHVTIQSTSTN